MSQDLFGYRRYDSVKHMLLNTGLYRALIQ